MGKNPLEAIVKIYNDAVEDADKLGYADTFKKCAELFFRAVNDNYVMEDGPVHFSDIEYLDGYYIFGFGTNSVVHFHIDECPGWKFGIWWSTPEEGKPYVSGEFFAQFEEAIDKFKPSASEICRNISIYPDESFESSVWSVSKEIRFIRNEPTLAFCRTYCGWDYNTEYHTREEAEGEYREYREREENKYHYTSLVDKKILKFVEEKVLPMFRNARIEDMGEGYHPRYDIVAPLKDNTDVVNEPGWYGWFENDYEDRQKVMAEFNALIEEGKKYGDQYGFYYFTPIHNSIGFYEE